MPTIVTMLQTRRGEDGSQWTAGSSYSASDAFAAFLITANYATGPAPANGGSVPAFVLPDSSIRLPVNQFRSPNKASLENRKTVGLLGHSLTALAMATPNRRVGPASAYSWANGVVTMTIVSHGLAVGASCAGDAQWDGGVAWSAMRVVGTAVDANTITFPLPGNPGPATADSLYFNLHAHPGQITITGISYASTTATLTVATALNLDTFTPGSLRFSLANCVGAGGVPIPALNAIVNACPTGCPAPNQIAFFIAGGDPGVALVSGTIGFLEQYQGTQNAWPIAMMNVLGVPWTITHNLSCGALRAGAIKGQAAYLASLPEQARPGFAMVGGAVNSLAAGLTTAADDLITAADICYSAGITPILYDEVPAMGLNSAPLTALYEKFNRNLNTLAKSRGYVLLTGFGSTLKPDATTAIPSRFTDTTFIPVVPPTVDGTHYTRYGAYLAAIALANSPGGQILQAIRRELPIAVGGSAGNILSNPMFGARTGGVNAGISSGNVPLNWQVNAQGVQTTINTVINRALPANWQANSTYAIGDCVVPISYPSANTAYVATTNGVTAGTEPVFPLGINKTVADGGVTWLAINRRALDGKFGSWLQCYMPPPTPLALSAAVQGATCSVTLSAATGLAINKRGLITGVVGMTQLNNRIWGVSAATTTPNLFADDTNATFSSAGFGAYVSGGVMLPMSTIQISPTGAIAKGTNWVTGDVMQLLCEFQHDDFFYGRAILAGATWPGGVTNGEMNASSYGSCVSVPKDMYIATQPFIAPLELTAAAQTLNPIFTIEMITGTFRIARPTLTNLTTA